VGVAVKSLRWRVPQGHPVRRATDAIDLIVRSDPVSSIPECHNLISRDVIVVPDSGTRRNVQQDLLIRVLRRGLDRPPRIGLTFKRGSRMEQQLAVMAVLARSKLPQALTNDSVIWLPSLI
jgi:hypothetical protein